MYTASFAFFEALWEAGVTHVFVNLGSDHPSILEAIVKGQKEKPDEFPRIITCPNEMVALSMADGYARLTNKPQCVIVHVDVGTQGLGAAVHNASCGRAPVLIFAGLSPYTIEGEYRGSRTEYIHWIQDVPDQKQILAQYCRYTGEIKRGRNVKQLVNRALNFAMSEPKGPVYLLGSREAMEEEINPYSINQDFWHPVELGGLRLKQVKQVSELLVAAEHPLVITGYSGRNHDAVKALVNLADTVQGLRVLDTGGSDMCFPANHPAWLGLRYGVEENIKTADVILVIDCDVPWINTQCKPNEKAKIIHIDVDPLKQQMPVFYINAIARYRADAETSVLQISEHIKTKLQDKMSSEITSKRAADLKASYEQKLQTIAGQAVPGKDGTFACSYLMHELRKACPSDTIWAIEAVTNTAFVADQIQATIPGSWINCGGGGLGWSGGGALGIKLASDVMHGGSNKGKFVCQIVGDGTYLFSVPGSVYWIAQRYKIPILTIVLNNRGWNAPRKSLLLVHPDGEGSKVDNDTLNIAFTPTPDYAGIAKAAAGGQCWAGKAGTTDELAEKLSEAIAAVKSGICAVLDAHLDGPQGKYGGGKAVLVG
ncbi:acetolactate synthase [Polychaeton citri CBS 116435]|uniref:Acetolactate synthase n=1 Tax=Polychaeton citri CBS 116435 TaxID=1314669 RepID=A0A9P4UKR3_9PEZI|nr:acetolactate synthase [Polychaeton citri CBS 116435]